MNYTKQLNRIRLLSGIFNCTVGDPTGEVILAANELLIEQIAYQTLMMMMNANVTIMEIQLSKIFNFKCNN